MSSFPIAFYAYFAIMLALLIYHLLILTRIIDYKNVWGGRLESTEQMQRFEAFSTVMLVIFTAIVYVRASGEEHIISIGLTGFVALFLLINAVANLFAIKPFERYVFTPLALVAGVSAFLIAIG